MNEENNKEYELSDEEVESASGGISIMAWKVWKTFKCRNCESLKDMPIGAARTATCESCGATDWEGN